MSEQRPDNARALRMREEQQRRERARASARERAGEHQRDVARHGENPKGTTLDRASSHVGGGAAPPSRASATLALQQRAGNQAVSSLLRSPARSPRRGERDTSDVTTINEQDERAERDADRMAERLVSAWSKAPATSASDHSGEESHTSGAGISLPARLRLEAEHVLGVGLGDVQLHADERAHEAADTRDAEALAFGRDIFFSRGRFSTESHAGRVLLGHELSHVAQQATTGMARAQAQPNKQKPKPKPKRVVRATVFVENKTLVYELEDDTTKTGRVEFSDGTPPAPGNYTDRLIKGVRHLIPDADTFNPHDGVITFLAPASVTFEGVADFKVRVFAGKPTVGGQTKLAASPSDPNAAGASDEKKVENNMAGGNATTPDQQKPPQLTEAEKKLWKELVEKMTGATQKDDTPVKEQLRLFELMREKIEDLQFAKAGDPWTKFAKFLDKNKDTIEGILKQAPSGTLTEEKIQKIIDQYGKFVASEEKDEDKDKSKDTKDEKSEAKEKDKDDKKDDEKKTDDKTGGGDKPLETVEDFDKEFKYDPGWAKLSKKDRELLVELAKLDPDSVGDAPIEFTSVTTSMKVMMALKLSWKSWPGETAAAAKAAFTDPTFIITLIVMMGIYVGLWLTPEPSGATKFAAGTLTAALLLQFSLEDIVGFAMAYSEMVDACEVATTADQIKAAGDRFAKKVGQVGFDIIMMIVMWRIGKKVGPKVQKIGAERGVKTAQAAVDTAAAKPGSGVAKMADPAKPKPLETAKSNAKGTTPTAVLDALEDTLSPEAKKGLGGLRNKAGDMGAYKSVEARTKAGVDLDQHLTELGMDEKAKAAAQVNLLNAEAKLARAKLIEADTLKDPQLRQAALDEAVRKLKARLSALNIFDDAQVKKAAAGGDVKDLVGALAEAIQRTQLKAEAADVPNGSVVSNLAVGRRIPGFKTIAEWKAAELKAGRDGKTAGIIQYGDEIYKLVGEADATIMQETKPGQYKPVKVEEVKGGSGDQPVSARAQLDKFAGGLAETAKGGTDVRVFQMSDKYTVGSDWTSKLDLSAVDSVQQSTRGPADKGFDKSLGYDADVLAEVAKSIQKDGLPPKNPTPSLPPTAPKDKEDKAPQ